MAQRKHGYCNLCRSRCGAIYSVEGDRVIAVEPDRGHPTGTALCAKGRAAPEQLDNPDRILTPLRRLDSKGAANPRWQAISWEAALSTVADRLSAIRAESGAEAVAFEVTTPSGTALSDSIEWIERFIRIFGSPNTIYGTEICNWHKDVAHGFTFGAMRPTPDYANARTIMLWGFNPSHVWLSQATRLAEAVRRGARLIVVDPRQTPHARDADLWLRVRPGADLALALGALRCLLRADRFDAGFVRRWTNAALLIGEDGLPVPRSALEETSDEEAFAVWDAVAGAVAWYSPSGRRFSCDADRLALSGAVVLPGLAGPIRCRPALDIVRDAAEPWTLARTAEATGLAEADIAALAEAFSGDGPVALYAWTGVGQHANATQTERAISILEALSGAFDRPGGNVPVARLPRNAVNSHDLLPAGQREKALGLSDRPLGPSRQGWITVEDFQRSVLEGTPYRTRALMGFGGNMLVSQASVAETEAALRALDFHVHCDSRMTPTAAHADIILPVTLPWEHEALKIGFELDAAAEELVQLRQRMVPPRGEARSDMRILFDLAVRLGHGDAFFGGSIEAGWDHMLAPTGLTVAALRGAPEGLRRPLEQGYESHARAVAGGFAGFNTPSGLVEIYSPTFLRHGQPPVPELAAPDESPAVPESKGGEGSRVHVTTAKDGFYCHSQHRDAPSLRRKAPEPMVRLHPDLAAAHSIEPEDWVVLSTPAGTARFRARLDPHLAADVVVADYGWWQGNSRLGLADRPVRGEGASNYNALVGRGGTDPVSGSVPMRGFPARLARDETGNPPVRAWSGERDFIIADIIAETPTIRSLLLRPADGGPLPAYLPGQHVTIALPDGQGEVLRRSYSLSGSSAAGLRISVRRMAAPAGRPDLPAGRGSGLVHDALTSGMRIGLGAPQGRFLPPLDGTPVVMIANGIGITPFLPYLAARAARPDATPAALIYGVRDAGEHAFAGEIAAAQAAVPALTVRTCYSRAEPPAGSDIRAGRVALDGIDALLDDPRTLFFLCGTQAMMTAMSAALEARGVKQSRVVTELFTAETILPPGTLEPRTIRMDQGEGVWTPRDRSLLDAAERAGLPVGAGCRVGQCESCAVDLLAGSVFDPDSGRIDGPARILACRTMPLDDITLRA